MDQEKINERILEEINHEIQVDLEDFELLKNTIATDKERGDLINCAYHTGMKVITSLNIGSLRNMLEVIEHIMNGEPIPDLLVWKPEEEIYPEAREIAKQIREMETWDNELNMELCKLAGLGEEYAAADGDSFEPIVFQAAERLGVNILEDPGDE